MNIKNTLATLLATTWLTACSSNAPDQSITDEHARDWMNKTEDKTSLKNKYYTMVENDGTESGILYAIDIKVDKNTDSSCMVYSALTSAHSDENSTILESETFAREACISNDIQPQ